MILLYTCTGTAQLSSDTVGIVIYVILLLILGGFPRENEVVEIMLQVW